MIQPHELRIGNYVTQKTLGIIKITGIDEDYIYTTYDNSDYYFKSSKINPIPITEDELIKLGFEKRESLSYNDWYIGINPITRDWLFYITWLKNPESINAPNVPFYKNGFHKLTYIHELQNLYFALTNQELTYKKD